MPVPSAVALHMCGIYEDSSCHGLQMGVAKASDIFCVSHLGGVLSMLHLSMLYPFLFLIYLGILAFILRTPRPIEILPTLLSQTLCELCQLRQNLISESLLLNL